MSAPPYPGEKGADLFENVSEKAWQEWLEHQKMLINEGQINLADRESRKWLNEQMELFLSGGSPNSVWEPPARLWELNLESFWERL